jgi:alpha-galactosidase
MKRLMAGLLVLAAPWIASAAQVDSSASHDKAGLDEFVRAHVERPEAPPFAFIYGGKPSSAFLANWGLAPRTAPDGERAAKTVSYKDPATGLRVTATYTLLSDFPAVEWVVRFKNEGASDTPIIGDIQACSVSFGDLPEGPVTLYRARGSNAERSDFAPLRDVLDKAGEVRFGPSGGRSSDTTALPFFNLAWPGRGIMTAIGWSGKWVATVQRTGSRDLTLEAGMEKTHFKLHPGEEIRTPSIALLFWKGDNRLAGHNLFRRFVLAHHTPRPLGRPVDLPLSHGIGFGGPFPCNEYVCATETYALAMIDRLKQFGIDPEACWIDAGWYETTTGKWWQGVGNWTVNRANFPRGLRPVTDAARAWGKGFVLWFEPERVYEGTRIDREHPAWLKALPGSPNRLFNLGDPEALRWLTGYVSDFIQSQGVTIYRQDFNFDPAPYWQAMDAPDRVGIAEMKHIEGLYEYWDALLARNPGLLIDNCASGGRRIDLETIGRSVPLWRTDYSYYEPNGYQCHTYGLHLFLPCSGTGNNNPQKYYFRSSMSGAVVMGWELNGSFNVNQAQEAITEFKALRPYFYGDFYPLTEYSTSDEAWAAFQWDRPERGDGIVLAFRRPQAALSAITVQLHNLNARDNHEVTFEDYGITLMKSGRELNQGLSVKIPEAPGSLLIKYRRLAKGVGPG